MNSALSQQSERERSRCRCASGDAVQNAQTVREVPTTRPEQKMNTTVPRVRRPECAAGFPAFNNQPDKGKVLGSIFATP